MKMDNWHRAEPREVRPFFESISAERALDGCGIQLYEDGEISLETSFELDEIDFQKMSLSVSVKVPDLKTWIGDQLSPAELELVLFARHGFLKRSRIVNKVKLSDKLPTRWEIDGETLVQLGGGRNTHITLAVCLAEDRSQKPGSPFIPGHWISKKTFLLRSRTMPTLFDLRIRKDEDWIAAGYPAKTYYAVDYLGGIDTELDEGASVATVWVHADAHAKLTTSSLSESMQPMLASEIIFSILLESFHEWKEQTQAVAESPLANLLQKLGGEKPMLLTDLRMLTSKPSLLRATLQDRLSVLASLR
jgi:hypothetical protein